MSFAFILVWNTFAKKKFFMYYIIDYIKSEFFRQVICLLHLYWFAILLPRKSSSCTFVLTILSQDFIWQSSYMSYAFILVFNTFSKKKFFHALHVTPYSQLIAIFMLLLGHFRWKWLYFYLFKLEYSACWPIQNIVV